VTDLYVDLLEMEDALIAGKTFNAGYQNHTIRLRKNDSEGSEMPQSVIPRAAMNLHRSQPHSYN